MTLDDPHSSWRMRLSGHILSIRISLILLWVLNLIQTIVLIALVRR